MKSRPMVIAVLGLAATVGCAAEPAAETPQAMIERFRREAAGAALNVWHEALKIDNHEVRYAALYEIRRIDDPRSLPVLDWLTKQPYHEQPKEEPDYPPFPGMARGIAESIRAKVEFQKMLAAVPEEAREAVAIKILKARPPWLMERALKYLQNLGDAASNAAVEGMIVEYAMYSGGEGQRNHLKQLTPKQMEHAYKMLETTDNGKVVQAIGWIIADREPDPEALPYLLKALAKSYRPEGYATIARASAKIAREALVDKLKPRWAGADIETRFRYALALEYVGTQKAAALLKEWHDDARQDALKTQEQDGMLAPSYARKVELVRVLRLTLKDIEGKKEQP
jgi:HEAT repeat protein